MALRSRNPSLVSIDWPRFCADVRATRILRDLSVRQLQQITGIPFSNISRVERGKGTCSAETFLALTVWLGQEPLSYTTQYIQV
jgi:transcriptional regulator with XRE-family HTH domain